MQHLAVWRVFALNLQLQTRQIRHHLLGGNFHAYHFARTRHAHRNLFAFGQLAHHFGHRPDLYGVFVTFTTADLLHQSRGVLQRLDLPHEIHTALKTMRRIRGEFVAAGFALNHLRREKRRLKENILRGQFRLAVPAAHHARHADRFFVVGDDQHIVLHFVGLLVQQLDRLAGFGHARGQTAAQTIQIINVHRLTEREHDVIGDVHQRGNRTMTGALQALNHPLRRWCSRIQVFNHAPREATTRRRRVNANRQSRVAIRHHRLDHQRRQRHRFFTADQRTHIARHATHRQTIRAVRREFDRINRVVQIQIAANVLAHRRRIVTTRRQFIQTARVGVNPQFLGRTQHPAGRHTAQFRIFDFKITRQYRTHRRARHTNTHTRIRRATNDLQWLGLTDIHLAHIQFIRIRVFVALDDLTHDDTRKRGRGRRHLLNFQAPHGQYIRERLAGNIGVNPLA